MTIQPAPDRALASEDRPPVAASDRLKRFGPLALLAIAAGLVLLSGVHKQLSLDALRANYGALVALVESRYWAALVVYAAIYVAAAAMSLPGAAILSLVGGLLFGAVAGSVTVVIAATIGATIVFTAARCAFGDFLKARASGVVERMEEGFRHNAFSYLLLLRLIPVFPFFLVNIAPAFFNVSTRVFVLTTLLGIIPGVFAYVSAGAGLGAVLEAGGEVRLTGLLLKPEVLTPIIAMSVLALIPVAAKAMGVRLAGGPSVDASADRSADRSADISAPATSEDAADAPKARP